MALCVLKTSRNSRRNSSKQLNASWQSRSVEPPQSNFEMNRLIRNCVLPGKKYKMIPLNWIIFFVNSKSSLATKWLTLTRPAPPGGCHCQRDGISMPGQTGWMWNEVTWRCATFWVLFCIMHQRDCSLLGVRAAIVILFIPMDSVLRVCFL